MLDALEHRQVTFSTLLRRLGIPVDASRIPLVPVCVNLDPGLDDLDFGAVKTKYQTVPRAFESFELFVNAVDRRDTLTLECRFVREAADGSQDQTLEPLDSDADDAEEVVAPVAVVPAE